MTNTQAWDRLAARRGEATGAESVQFHDDVCHEMVEAFAAGEPNPVWPED